MRPIDSVMKSRDDPLCYQRGSRRTASDYQVAGSTCKRIVAESGPKADFYLVPSCSKFQCRIERTAVSAFHVLLNRRSTGVWAIQNFIMSNINRWAIPTDDEETER